MIALHRPYMSGQPGHVISGDGESWRLRALQRAKIAASNIDGTLTKMTASKMIQGCHAMMYDPLPS